MMSDPVLVVVEALLEKGYDVHPETEAERANIAKEALSSEAYIWVQEIAGSTPHIEYADRPTIEIIVYSNQGIAEATRLARQVQRDLFDSRGIKFTSGGIHRVITLIRPHREDLQGVPPGIGRAVAQYELILASQAHWSIS